MRISDWSSDVCSSDLQSLKSIRRMLMKPRSFADMRCPVAGALEVVGDRWTLLLIRDLSLGLSRYDAFRASTGIPAATLARSEEHTSELQSLMRISYAVFCLKKKNIYQNNIPHRQYVDINN